MGGTNRQVNMFNKKHVEQSVTESFMLNVNEDRPWQKSMKLNMKLTTRWSEL